MSHDLRNDGLMRDLEAGIVVRPIACQECRRPWKDGTERWRMYVASFSTPLVVPYCPQCAFREFG
jgi:RNase P subunit RPR2